VQDVTLVELALSTLPQFQFRHRALLEFVRDTVCGYLDAEDPRIRKAAAGACSKARARGSVCLDAALRDSIPSQLA
jgi:FKBP12-rapamycin complex-associated protein